MTAVSGLAAALAAWLVAWPSPAWVGAPRRFAAWPTLALGVVVTLVLLPRGWLGPALVVSLGALGARVLTRRRAQTRQAERNAALMAQVCDLVAAELAAGRPPDSALREAAVTWAHLRPVADAGRLGGDVPRALREAAELPGAGGLRLLAAAWVVSARTGGSLVTSTRRVADAVRRDEATRRLVAGELASARATARLVAALPVAALLMGSGAGADPWRFLVTTTPGLGCLGSGLAVGFCGLWWIELIAADVER